MMGRLDRRQLLGWIPVAISTVITGFWAFWGIIENFHEGWYHAALLSNLGLMFVQYLSPMLVLMTVTVIAILWPRVGAGLHGLLAFLAAWFFQAFTDPILPLIILPLVGLGVLYWLGRPQPRSIALYPRLGCPSRPSSWPESSPSSACPNAPTMGFSGPVWYVATA